MTDGSVALRRTLAVACAVATAVCTSCSRPAMVAPSRSLSAAQIADRAKPGTVWVTVETTAAVEVPELSIHEDALRLTLSDRVTPEMSGEAIFRAMVEAVLQEPDRFLVRSDDVRRREETVYSTGSGLVLTKDGYVATNAHVVKPSPDELKKALVQSIRQWVQQDLAGIEDDVQRILRGATIVPAARERLMESLVGYYTKSANLADVSTKVFVVTGYSGASDSPDLVRVPCEVVRVGEPAPGKDVAILKMDGNDVPTLPLAPSLAASQLRTGSDIHIAGFPGGTMLNHSFSVPSRLVPSHTSGKVSAFRDMGEPGDRWQVIETDTTINRGNSGGPAFDERGNVVGLATFSLDGQPGINYVVAVDVVHQFMRELNVVPTTSEFTKRYLDALSSYDAGQRDVALSKFRLLQADRAAVRAVDDFVGMLSGGAAAPLPPGDDGAPARPTLESPQHASGGPAARERGGISRSVIIFGLFASLLAALLAVVVMSNRN